MKPISRIKILGSPWAVSWQEKVTDDDGNSCFGTSDLEKQVIAIEEGLTPYEKEQETFIHELIHVLKHIAEIEDNEEETSRFARVLLAVLKDNPNLLTYLKRKTR